MLLTICWTNLYFFFFFVAYFEKRNIWHSNLVGIVWNQNRELQNKIRKYCKELTVSDALSIPHYSLNHFHEVL